MVWDSVLTLWKLTFLVVCLRGGCQGAITGEVCDNTNSCDDGTICSDPGICVCNMTSMYYYAEFCTNRISLEGECPGPLPPIAGNFCLDEHAECRVGTATPYQCLCISTHYSDDGVCLQVGISDPPENINVANVTSRSFAVSWEQPEHIYSDENLGYLLEVKADTKCVEQVTYMCDGCLQTQIPQLFYLCGDGTNSETIQVPKDTLLSGVMSRTVDTLLPGREYTVYVSAINNVGSGSIANISLMTITEDVCGMAAVSTTHIGEGITLELNPTASTADCKDRCLELEVCVAASFLNLAILVCAIFTDVTSLVSESVYGSIHYEKHCIDAPACYEVNLFSDINAERDFTHPYTGLIVNSTCKDGYVYGDGEYSKVFTCSGNNSWDFDSNDAKNRFCLPIQESNYVVNVDLEYKYAGLTGQCEAIFTSKLTSELTRFESRLQSLCSMGWDVQIVSTAKGPGSLSSLLLANLNLVLLSTQTANYERAACIQSIRDGNLTVFEFQSPPMSCGVYNGGVNVDADSSGLADGKITCNTNHVKTASSVSEEFCVPCGPGYIYDNGVCASCPAGKYQNQIDQSSCIDCLSGFPILPDQTACKSLCPEGYFSVDSFYPCQPCQGDTFSSSPTTCEPCPNGASTVGKTAVTSVNGCHDPCPVGSYSQSGYGDVDCIPCPVNFYQSEPASTACIECPAFTTTPHTGSIAADDCVEIDKASHTPYNVAVSNIGQTSLRVNWTMDGPSPGHVTYFIHVIAETGAPSFVFNTTGWHTNSYDVTGLEEYWNYKVQVTAETSEGQNTSDTTAFYRTLPAAPGPVSEMFVEVAPGGDYTRIKITWEAPSLLQRNGVIKEYNFATNASLNPESDTAYTRTVGVIPERSYFFQVYAVNVEPQDIIGYVRTVVIHAPPGVPKNDIEDILGLDMISVNSSETTETSITLSIVTEFFNQDDHGTIRDTGILGCAVEKCNFLAGNNNMALTQFESFPSYNTAASQGFTMYRITHPSWLQHLAGGGKRRAIEERTDFIVGIQNCANIHDAGYCNGPLVGGTEYKFALVVCTNGGCLLSSQYGPYKTREDDSIRVDSDTVDSDTNMVGLIVGICVAVGAMVGMFVAFLVIFARRRNGTATGLNNIANDELHTVANKNKSLQVKVQPNRPVTMKSFIRHLDNMHQQDDQLFTLAFQDLGKLTPSKSSITQANHGLPAAYQNMDAVPSYADSRVKIVSNKDTKQQYLDGNFIPGCTSAKDYIVCDGPISKKAANFWSVVIQERVQVIVMLTNRTDKASSDQYLPTQLNRPQQYGDVTVVLKSQAAVNDYHCTTVTVSRGDITRTVNHFHYTKWSDFYEKGLVAFINHVRSNKELFRTPSPLVVHCSQGADNAGTFIATDTFLHQIMNSQTLDEDIDVFGFVVKMRHIRPEMVPNERQFIFIHECIGQMIRDKEAGIYTSLNLSSAADDTEYNYLDDYGDREYETV